MICQMKLRQFYKICTRFCSHFRLRYLLRRYKCFNFVCTYSWQSWQRIFLVSKMLRYLSWELLFVATTQAINIYLQKAFAKRKNIQQEYRYKIYLHPWKWNWLYIYNNHCNLNYVFICLLVFHVLVTL